MGRQAVNGVKEMHDCGLTHRDIHKGNIFLNFMGEDQVTLKSAKLGDLGKCMADDDLIKTQVSCKSIDLPSNAEYLKPMPEEPKDAMGCCDDIYKLSRLLYDLFEKNGN